MEITHFEASGLNCTIMKHPELGTLCGYIDIPVGHPLYGQDSMECEIPVHGGWTYSMEHDGMWRFGFDCAHAGDAIPAIPSVGGIYRDESYVREELERAAMDFAGYAGHGYLETS